MDKPDILIVDDERANRILLIEYLNMLEVNVDEAESGEECLGKLKEKSYTLICLDISMPGMDGYQVLEAIRSESTTAYIPVILISAIFQSEEHILKGIVKGAIDFIPKPINPSIFLSKVNNFIQLYEKQQKLDQLVKNLENTNNRLRENEQKFKRITQSALDAIIVLDPNYKLKFCNKAAQYIFGYNKYELLTESIFDSMISLKSEKQLLKHIHDLTKSESKLNNSIRLTGKKKLGTEFPIELSLAVFKTAHEEINFTAIIRDISHQVKNEKEALAAKELREANKVMKEFMDNMSHELRTPMNAIIGISNMFLKYNTGNLTTDQIEGLKLINQSGSRLLEMINDILDISRLESKKQKIRIEHFNLEEFLANIRSLVITLINEKPIKFIIRKSHTVPENISTDPKILSQILTNLLSNAVKFTNEGSIRLFTHCHDNKIYFEVTDSGIGIDEENLKRIFRRFEQIDNSASKEYKGTGLGLNITKKLVELMNGEIQVESQIDKGTTMRFFLPAGLDIADEPKKELIAEKNNLNAELFNKNDKKLAVIIDFRDETHFLLKRILEEENYISYACYNSSTGIKAIARLLPDIIVLKMEMPKIHGQLLLKELAKSKVLIKIPILIITSLPEYIQKESINTSVILSEPINQRDITENLKKLGQITKKSIISDVVILSEKKLNQFAIEGREFEFFYNDAIEMSKLIIARRQINVLLLDGIGNNSNNSEIIKWLILNKELRPTQVYVIEENISDELKELKLNFSNLNVIRPGDINSDFLRY